MSYICFKVHAETRYLQCVRVCGNHPSLGQWDPQQSMQLNTTNLTYPEWTHENKILIDPSFNLEFKCLIQDGNNYIWETIPNRKLKCDFRRNFVFIKFNTFGMDLRTFQKYEISHEFVQEELMQVQRLERSRDYDPFNHDIDSSDNESIPEVVKQLNGLTVSIKELETNWREIIESHFENKLKQQSISKLRKISDNYGSPDLTFDYRRKRSQSSSQIFSDQYVICLCFKIPIKITTISGIKVLQKKGILKIYSDIPLKYSFFITADPYYSHTYDLFSNRLSLKAIWIGWIGLSCQEPEFTYLQQYMYELSKISYEQFNCYGIRLNGQQYIEGCFRQWLEPIFSNMTPNLLFNCEEDYLELNRIFAQYAIEAMFCTLFGNQFNHLHSIFIFDYHLFLVPSFMKEGLIQKNEYRPRICTIMKKQFPTPKQFRIISCSQLILSSLLMSDLLSLVELRDLHQFVSSVPFQFQKLTQISGMSAFTLEVLGRKIILDYGNIGLNQRQYASLKIQSDDQANQDIIFIGVDCLSIYSGLTQKLKIIESVFKLHQHIKLIQVIYVHNEEDFEENTRKNEYLEQFTQEANIINDRFQREIITIIVNPNQLERVELYQQADIFLKTSLRENISQAYLEYIYVRQFNRKSAKLVLSQWSLSKVEHQKINPQNIQESAKIIFKYLFESKPNIINVPSSDDWLLRLNDHLHYCEDYWLDKQLYDSAKELTLGLKDRQFYSMETNKVISRFLSPQVKDNQRIMILVYSELFKQKIVKVDQLVYAFEQLAKDQNNTLIIISDMECEIMELTFGTINNLYIIAQDGLFIKQNGQTVFQQIVDRNEMVETKLEQLANQEHFTLKEQNLIYTLELKEKVEDSNAAANIVTQNVIRQLKQDLDGFIIYQESHNIKIKHQYQQVEELLKIIIYNEVSQKGLVSFANIISFDKQWSERIIQLFQYSNMPLNKQFHCVSISDQIGKNSNLVLESTQEIILLLNKYASENICEK